MIASRRPGRRGLAVAAPGCPPARSADGVPRHRLAPAIAAHRFSYFYGEFHDRTLRQSRIDRARREGFVFYQVAARRPAVSAAPARSLEGTPLALDGPFRAVLESPDTKKVHIITAGGGGDVLGGAFMALELKRILGPGDAYCFESRRPHRFRCLGADPCEVISACTPPSF